MAGVIAATIIIVAVGIIIGIRIYRNPSVDLDAFIEEYGDEIIDVLQDAITILQTRMDSYNSQEEYERAIINTAIASLKKSAANYGISNDILDLIDEDALAGIIANIFSNNKTECLNVLSVHVLTEHENIIDPIVLKENNTDIAN